MAVRYHENVDIRMEIKATIKMTISGIPEGTKSLALIMDDPDAMEAVGKVWVHWVVWNIDNIASRSTNGGHRTQKKNGVEGMTDFGEVGYGGPAPPDKRHTYVFKLYALDTDWIFLKEIYKG